MDSLGSPLTRCLNDVVVQVGPHIRDEIEQLTLQISNDEAEIRHSAHQALEAHLWYANLFIIPLIVYPIVTLIGHLALALTSYENQAEYADTTWSYLNPKRVVEVDRRGRSYLSPEVHFDYQILFDKSVNLKKTLDIYKKVNDEILLKSNKFPSEVVWVDQDKIDRISSHLKSIKNIDRRYNRDDVYNHLAEITPKQEDLKYFYQYI